MTGEGTQAIPWDKMNLQFAVCSYCSGHGNITKIHSVWRRTAGEGGDEATINATPQRGNWVHVVELVMAYQRVRFVRSIDRFGV